MRLLAPAGIGALLAEHVGLTAEPLKSGTVGPAATAGLAAAGDIDAMIAFSDPIELRPGDNTTRSLTRLAIFWDIPIASNRATADLLLATVTAANQLPPGDLAAAGVSPASSSSSATGKSGGHEPVRGAIKLWTVRATVDDVPGRLAILAASLARRAINILSVQVHLTPDGPVDELGSLNEQLPCRQALRRFLFNDQKTKSSWGRICHIVCDAAKRPHFAPEVRESLNQDLLRRIGIE